MSYKQSSNSSQSCNSSNNYINLEYCSTSNINNDTSTNTLSNTHNLENCDTTNNSSSNSSSSNSSSNNTKHTSSHSNIYTSSQSINTSSTSNRHTSKSFDTNNSSSKIKKHKKHKKHNKHSKSSKSSSIIDETLNTSTSKHHKSKNNRLQSETSKTDNYTSTQYYDNKSETESESEIETHFYPYSIQTNIKYQYIPKYQYSVQTEQPKMTYDNYVIQTALNNMSPQEYKYYQKLQKTNYNYNGNYQLLNNKPTKMTIQSKLKTSFYPRGSTEVNGTLDIYNLDNNNNNGSIQVYTNTPAYIGIQPKTSREQTAIANMNAQQTKANNANINNPAYFNYGKYYY